MISKRRCSICRNTKGAYIVIRIKRIVLGGDVNVRNLSNHALRLLKDKNYRLTIETTYGTNTILVVNMSRLVLVMRSIVTKTASTPVIIRIHLPTVFRGGTVIRVCINMLRCYVGLNIFVADTTVKTVTTLIFQFEFTTPLTKKGFCLLTAFTNCGVMETTSAILTKVSVVVTILNANRRNVATFRVPLTTIKTKPTKFAYFDSTKSISAIEAEMVIPIGVLNAVFTTFATLVCGIVHTAEYAESAIVTKVYAILVKTFLTLLANNATLLTVIVPKSTFFVGAVTVAALSTVHIIRFRAFLTEAAAVAKSAHTVCTAPAYTAKIIFHYVVTFVTLETVPTIR